MKTIADVFDNVSERYDVDLTDHQEEYAPYAQRAIWYCGFNLNFKPTWSPIYPLVNAVANTLLLRAYLRSHVAIKTREGEVFLDPTRLQLLSNSSIKEGPDTRLRRLHRSVESLRSRWGRYRIHAPFLQKPSTWRDLINFVAKDQLVKEVYKDDLYSLVTLRSTSTK